MAEPKKTPRRTTRRPTTPALAPGDFSLATWRRIHATGAMAALIVSGKLAKGNVNKLAWARMAYEWADAMGHAGKVH